MLDQCKEYHKVIIHHYEKKYLLLYEHTKT